MTITPMKMTDIPVTDFDLYVNDDDWVLEQKHDGARALVHVLRSGDGGFLFEWFASGGGPLKFAAAALHFEALQTALGRIMADNDIVEAWFDGELMPEEGTLRLFDVPMLLWFENRRLNVYPEDSYANRKFVLTGLEIAQTAAERIEVTYSATTSEEKLELWEKINAAGVEGGILKHVMASYEPGVRSKQYRKLKLVKTADVIVSSVERKFDHKGMVTHGSAGLEVMIRPEQDPRPWISPVAGKRLSDEAIKTLEVGTKAQQARALAHVFSPRDRLPVGAASLIGKDLTIDVGDVVEVNYLYWGGDALVQPRIVRKRLPEEKPADDCWIDQIPAYSRRAVR
ncbi:DNA ligase [Microbacterium phage Dewdrop]|nr:DNA ligase [Microbacterium phage Leaf]QGZ17379.1 DNA ligase [Microbacterium phage Dewdrop]